MRTSFAHTLFVAILALTLSNCGPEDPGPGAVDESQAEKNARTLTTGGAWNLQSVTVDGVDKTSVYKDLKVTFTATGFSATSGGVVWPSAGTWQFAGDEGTTITRDDGLSITVAEIAEKKLVLRLAWTKNTLGGGRPQSVAGQHVFTFTR